jgi:hypothetical protein
MMSVADTTRRSLTTCIADVGQAVILQADVT